MDGIKKGIIKSFKELKWYEWIMIVIMTLIAAKSVIDAINGNSSNPLWLTIINFVSAICGIICVFFTAKANISNFIFAIINTFVYAIYLYYWKIWGTFYLEVLFYTPMNFISWYYWNKNHDKKLTHKTKSKKLTLKQNILVILGIIVLTIIVHTLLSSLAGDSWLKLASDKGWNSSLLAWLDSSTFAIGIVAVILELLRYREQYAWWIITDIIAVSFYILHYDLVYLTKKSIYLIMAIVGIINWIKLNKERNINNE